MTMVVNKDIEFLTVARREVCYNRFFQAANPAFYCGLTQFPAWFTVCSAENRDLLYHFLNGDTVVRENNWVEFIVPHPTMNETKLLDHLFYRNKNFKLLQTFQGEHIEAKIVPGSVKLLRSFAGNAKEFGGRYIKLKLGFTTKVRLLKPVPDLSDEELENHYVFPVNGVPVDYRRAHWRALKAFMHDSKAIYCSRSDAFIAKAPRTDEEYDRIFAREMSCNDSSEFGNLFKFGVAMAFTPEDRRAIEIGAQKLDIKGNGNHEGSMYTSIMDSATKNGVLISIRTPRTDVRPHLFVQNVRKGVECCRSCMSSWMVQKRADTLNIKYGCFEITVEKFRQRVGWQYFYSICNQNTFDSMGRRDVADQRILEFATAYLNDVLAFLEATANFVEKLLAGTKSVETLNANLSQRVLDVVRISPFDFIESKTGIIKDLANRCVLGTSCNA